MRGRTLPLYLIEAISSSGVCHADDLWHVFKWDFPLVWCDLRPILSSLAMTGLDCVLQNTTGIVDYGACMSDPQSVFIHSSGDDCINGSLTNEDVITSYEMAQAFATFVTKG